MGKRFISARRGFTIIELMVTVVITAILATTLGTFVVKLLTLREKDREEAYIREKLVDICGIYADSLSLGSSVATNFNSHGFCVSYRQETGGVSLETGRVSRLVKLISDEKVYHIWNNSCTNLTMETFSGNGEQLQFSPEFSGDDTPLMTAKDLKLDGNPVNLNCTINPLDSIGSSGALWNLRVRADYKVKDDLGNFVLTNATVERVVRLWNRH